MPPAMTLPPIRAFIKQAGEFGENLCDAAASSLRVEHELIMTAAKADTPVRFGVLHGSGTVFPTVREGTRLVSRGGFGGAAKEYAVFVHENLTARHAVGHAKFYENALLNGAKGLDARLAAGMRRRMR